MAHYKKGGVKEFKETKAFEEHQTELKKQHNIEDENIVVVEKTNAAKFTVNIVIRLIKLVGTTAILLLAVIGLLSIIYPETREQLLLNYNNIVNEITAFWGG